MSDPGDRPLIGCTAYRQTTSWWSWERDAALVPGAYLDMVVRSGGRPVLLPPIGDDDGPDAHRALVAALDGLVLVGGGDVDPARYRQPADPRGAGISDRRDALEFGLLAAALDADLPVLAICRGAQVLNVARGGTLVQHLPDVLGATGHQPRPGAFGRVTVDTVEGTVARRVLGERLEVPCSHHQALGDLGSGLVVSATSDDGVVEAVELPGWTFVVGVQWHPEEDGDDRLCTALLDAVRRSQPA